MNNKKVYTTYLQAYAGVSAELKELPDELLVAHIMGRKDGNRDKGIKNFEEVRIAVREKIFPEEFKSRKRRPPKKELFEE